MKLTKAIDRYAQLIEMSEWCDCEECQKQKTSSARAVIEAFVEDLAKAMCPYCRDGIGMMDAGLGLCHLSWDGATFLGLIPCQSVMMRAAASRLVEES